MKELTAEENLLISGGWLASDAGNRTNDPFSIANGWQPGWVVRFDEGGSWLDTGSQCVPLNPTRTQSDGWSQGFYDAIMIVRDASWNYIRENCSVNATTSPPFIEIECVLLGK
jgi:hypothetical protein